MSQYFTPPSAPEPFPFPFPTFFFNPQVVGVVAEDQQLGFPVGAGGSNVASAESLKPFEDVFSSFYSSVQGIVNTLDGE